MKKKVGNRCSHVNVVRLCKIAGLGRKFADLIQYFTQLVASYAVGFYLSWKLTVVLIASFPVIAGAGAFMINAVTAAQVTYPTHPVVRAVVIISHHLRVSIILAP